MNKIAILILSCLAFNAATNAQMHINREWELMLGNPSALQWTNSIVNDSAEVITVGNSVIPGQGVNILLTKNDKDGYFVWQKNFNTGGTANDYGINLEEDASGNIYVVGATDNGNPANHDIVLLKYNAGGTLLWSTTYAAPFGLNDVPSDVTIDGSGNIYLCAASESSATNFDFLTLKYNASGTLQWEQRYDYSGLPEAPININIDISGNLFVTGASAATATDWDYTLVRYNTSTGSFLGDIRNSLPGFGYDQPFACKKDALGNIYITGKGSSDGINYDVKTIKMDTAYTILWTSTFDLSGKEDAGTSIDVDDAGNIYVGGYITKSNDIKEMFLISYDASGNEQWHHRQPGADETADAMIMAVQARSGGEIYFAAEEKSLGGTRDAVVSKIDISGNLGWQKRIGNAFDDRPTALNVADNGNIYLTVVESDVIDQYKIFKYSEFSTDSAVVLGANAQPSHKAHELIVRFMPSAINTSSIDNIPNNREIEFAGIDYFLTPSALNAFNEALSDLCGELRPAELHANPNPCNITAVKIFKQLKTTHTTTTSRLGETIPIPDFWTALLLVFPPSLDIAQVHTALQSIPGVVVYSEPNYIAHATATANDSLYPQQYSLHPNLVYPDAHINVEEAWDVVPDGGKPFVKCGVFDSGIEWTHDDFGFNGIQPNSSKVVKGWNFITNSDDKTSWYPDNSGHGTGSAGIIGAIRNNSNFIAGIAGGDFNNAPNLSDKGISLYNLHIIEDGIFIGAAVMTGVYNAIVTSAIDSPSLDYGYGLHIASNSWRIGHYASSFNDTNFNLLKEATHFANRAQVTFVASRGNEGTNNSAYPAVIDDDWILSVGGTGLNGDYLNLGNGFSGPVSYGSNLDIAAPGTQELIYTTTIGNDYDNMGGTSAAAPHVAGTVGLMMSYWNTPTASYQNLAPEDCERIIELSATDVNSPGYDDSTGYGRLDAGKALRLIEKPWNAVRHFGTDAAYPYGKSFTQVANNTVIELKERARSAGNTWYPAGQYRANVYRVDATVAHNLNPDEEIVAYWARPSSSTVLEGLDGYNNLRPRERLRITYLDANTCDMIGYVYHLSDMVGNPLGWLPYDPAALPEARFEYSILTHNINAPTNIKGKTSGTDVISLYPNPGATSHTLGIRGTTGETLLINLYDIQGRLLRNVYDGKLSADNFSIKSDIHELAPAMYFYMVQLGEKKKQIRFVKQ